LIVSSEKVPAAIPTTVCSSPGGAGKQSAAYQGAPENSQQLIRGPQKTVSSMSGGLRKQQLSRRCWKTAQNICIELNI